ncbi:hypothetical protein ScPMuIL_000218 [Solemya velum]
MASTWGRRSVKKTDRTEIDKDQHDQILQSLGSQLNVDFTDYEQWKRTRSPKYVVQQKQEEKFVVNRPLKSADSVRRVFLEKKKASMKTEVFDKDGLERIKLIELRLRTRRKTLLEYESRYKELLEQNIMMKGEIDTDEHGVLDQVKGLLRKYEKYRGGITTLNTNFTKEYHTAYTELELTRSKVNNELTVLEKQVNEIDEKLRGRQDELHVLMSYKDKEYPVKAMRIANLQKEIQSLQISNQEDQEELEHIIHTELDKYEKDRNVITSNITKTITEEAISQMHPSLKDMALQNMVMKKEVEFHQREQEMLEQTNRELQTEVEMLLRAPQTNTRLQMFPEFFPALPKCTPDMDVVLDIPTQQWVPI